jgi:hypothetical protein
MGNRHDFICSEDCRRFVLFSQERDPVIVTEWRSSESAEIEEVNSPWEEGVGAQNVAPSDPSADPDSKSLWRTYRYLRVLGSPRTRL